jgi:hypothetical protein
MKINQSLVTQTFQCRNNTSGLYHELKEAHHIQDVLKRGLGVTISESESIDFWHWRCNECDGSWFGIDSSHTNDSDIIEWFQEFIKFVGVKDDKDAEDYFDSQQKIGVKVVVKDAEGAPWEIELDPDYHAQLIRDIESQIPEKSVGGTIRYSLEYDSKKIWNMRKL